MNKILFRHLAISNEHGEIAQLLINAQANQNLLNIDEKKPMDLASDKIREFLKQ